MATIKRSLAAKSDVNGKNEVYLRVTVGRGKQFRLRSGISVNEQYFRDGTIIKPKKDRDAIIELTEIESTLNEIENRILKCCATDPDEVTKEKLEEVINTKPRKRRKKKADEPVKTDFFTLWNVFIDTRQVTEHWKCSYRSLVRALHRYECYRKETEGKRFKLTVVGFDTAMLTDFETFYRNEHLLYDQYPDIYLEYPAELRMQHSTHRPQQRGDNMVVDVMKRIRAFYNWCIDQGYAVTKPTDKYQGVKTAKYGTPFYLTREERDRIADFDLSGRPQLAIQRDIFVFQCLIGCRVSDLYSLTSDNFINGAVEYIPGKTKKDRLDTVRVPLNPKAKEILERYKGGARLFPYISQQRYNDAIKEVCKVCGIDRIVTVINPTTGQDERRPIWEVASSHMARRTFIGTLYKQVKDPNFVGALSGHKEGSRAFARYREIDDDIRRDLIDLL